MNNENFVDYILKQLQTTPYIVNNFLKMNTDDEFKYRNIFQEMKKHIDDFLGGYDENRFMVMPGLRGIGKSTLIFQLYNYLINKGIDLDRILYLSIDQINSLPHANIENLISTFVESIHDRYPATLDKELFIFIDEAQEDENWSKTGKIIYDQTKKIFMIFTGSNALDFELDKNAARRTSIQRIYPMNFQEYLYLKYNIPPTDISNDLINMILTSNVGNTLQKEREILSHINLINKPLSLAWNDFLCYGGFPLTLNLDHVNSHYRIYEIVDRIIDKDVRRYKAFNGNTKRKLFNIISFIATQKPGNISLNKLSKHISTSRSNVIELIDILENTHLIFHILPYGGASKMIRKPSKYYFLSPSLTASINFTIGKHNPNNNDYMGVLAETLVASTFFRLNNTIHRPQGIFYPTEKGMCDFIITNWDGDKIAIEVGVGSKDKKQVTKTMRKYNCKHAIIISQTTEFIKKDGNIIYLPLKTFSLI